jgi:hypothetical protein
MTFPFYRQAAAKVRQLFCLAARALVQWLQEVAPDVWRPGSCLQRGRYHGAADVTCNAQLQQKQQQVSILASMQSW